MVEIRANHGRRSLGRIFRMERECMYPKPATYVSQVILVIMQREEMWKPMMSELGRMSALFDVFVRRT